MNMENVYVIKKDGTRESFNGQKIITAIGKSAARILITLTPEENEAIVDHIENDIASRGLNEVPIATMHNLVEAALNSVNEKVAKSYRDYRNYKKEFVHMMDDVYKKSQAIRYIGDKDNANTDSALVATKRSLIFNELNKELYRKFFLTRDELQACKDGYIYVHDQSARLDTINCFERETQFITKDGIKSFLDFEDGDHVSVISHKGNWRDATVHCYGIQKLQTVTFANGHYVKNVAVTPNHRWILEDGTETTCLKEGDVLVKTPAEYGDCDEHWKVICIIPADIKDVWCLNVEEDHSFLLEGGIPTGNCCLFDVQQVITGGFEMGNVWYNEPKTLDTAFDVLGDVILSTASQQYGGFTVPEVDSFLEPYAEKSYVKYRKEFLKNALEIIGEDSENASDAAMEQLPEKIKAKAERYALKKVRRDYEQGFQGIEYKLNTVGSSRGDYPFITFTFGLATGKLAKMGNIVMMEVHMEGQGKEGFKRPVLFPKYVFLYDENLHGPGKECEDVFEAAIQCSAKTMYPDWLSLTGDGYVANMYKKYGRVISPMGCRAFLSPWYERGGMNPADENDKPVYVGRCNLGAISLHLPMILAKARRESRDFYEVLDEYMELIRGLHKRTYDYIGELRASVNPVMFCEGGLLGGHLKPNEKIRDLLPPMTMSYGITALNELQELYNGKSLVEDNSFALEVMKHINEKLAEYKAADHILYAVYGTPAESLCFCGSTTVQTYSGDKMIKDIVPGDLVYSYNEKERKVELKKVVASQMTRRNADTVKVTFDNGQEVICTPNHKFAVNNNEIIEYVEAIKLRSKDRVKSNAEYDNEVVSVVPCERMDVFDIEVEDNHNFFVGEGIGVLVHNCGLQIEQFRKEFGIIHNVSDRPYVSNSFHCHVSEQISPIRKQDLEYQFWDYFNGGKIQYVRYPLGYNIEAVRTIVRRAMKMGFYEGVNLALSYCDDCGYQAVDLGDVCPICGSKNLTKIDRMNGYLAYSRRKGDTRLNRAKMAEIAERKSM